MATSPRMSNGAQKTVRLFVGGLPPLLTASELARRFDSFGRVVDTHIVPSKFPDKKGEGRGFVGCIASECC